ncbi:RecE family exodeoxyribonuclease [Klebsiella aerogenes]
MEYFHLIKATQKSGKADAVIWRSAKSESRANLQLDVDMEDAGIETGRGKDYMKPVRTDFPVFNDLPEEGVLDFEWCKRYQLADDGRTWELKAGQVPNDAHHSEDISTPETSTEESVDTGNIQLSEREMQFADDENAQFNIATMPFRTQLLAQYMAEEGHVYHISVPHRKELITMEMDTDNSAIQDLILSTENEPEIKKFDIPTLWKYTSACKKVFPDGKRHELGKRIQFAKLWVETPHIDRGLLTKEWAAGNRITSVQHTDNGTNAGGGNKTDRNPDYVHTLDTLDQEIALATLPMDFDIYNFPASVHRRAKEIIADKESPWKEWSAALRSVPGILDYSRAAIFAMIRGAGENVHHFPDSLRRYINSCLTESEHDKPSAETIAAARHTPDRDESDEIGRQLAAARGEYVEGISNPNDPKWVSGSQVKAKQPEVASLGAGVFSIEGLMASPAPTNTKEEATSDVQMEETQPIKDETDNAISAGESADVPAPQTDAVNVGKILAEHCPDLTAAVLKDQESDSATGETVEEVTAEAEPETAAPAWPEYFEPGRYEGVPNEVYHAANGISSTQVKDARISLMYFHGRHVEKTIARESTDALTFGSLIHTLGLEPEKFEAEFAVFPGIPAGAFTNTDTLKAFIREYNVDKPKAEQLKLTGKKEELQEAIRAVNPDAIFADEFEQEWNESNRDKTIISATQLAHAKAIQQALFNHPTAGKLLTHPSRAIEVSYFGIDEETGLEVRVRPDLEIDMGGLRIGGDLKSITVGKIKQEALRARLHREIIDRDYHLSAAMYCDVATFDQFYWIFVNKDENYHWIAIIEASEELLELGMLEYRKAMRAIAHGFDSGEWPAPITEDYAEELNDFDVRRLEALRVQA